MYSAMEKARRLAKIKAKRNLSSNQDIGYGVTFGKKTMIKYTIQAALLLTVPFWAGDVLEYLDKNLPATIVFKLLTISAMAYAGILVGRLIVKLESVVVKRFGVPSTVKDIFKSAEVVSGKKLQKKKQEARMYFFDKEMAELENTDEYREKIKNWTIGIADVPSVDHIIKNIEVMRKMRKEKKITKQVDGKAFDMIIDKYFSGKTKLSQKPSITKGGVGEVPYYFNETFLGFAKGKTWKSMY